MKERYYKYSFRALSIILFIVFFQGSRPGREVVEFRDSSIPLITCRMNDTLSHGCDAFLNSIDKDNPLKIYNFSYISDSGSCNRLESLTDLAKATDDNNELLLFVHGHYKSFTDAAISGLRIQNLYNVKVLAYSWPSMMNRSPGAKNYLYSKGNVEAGTAAFRDLLELIRDFKVIQNFSGREVKINLCLHSLGNYFLERMVEDSLLYGLPEDLFENIIINAAAVEHEGHSKWVDKLNIQKRIYITINEKDFNLAGVRSFTDSGVQLGRHPELPHSDKAVYVDFTDAVGFRLPTGATHNYFTGKMALKNRKIHQFFEDLFHGRPVNLKDNSVFREKENGMGYMILP
jgi:hypothetical protein